MNDYIIPLKALADPHRLRVFWLLAHIDERICVNEAMEVLGVSHYNASRHLSQLKRAGLVKSFREGKHTFYALNHDAGLFLRTLLEAVRTIPPHGFECDISRCKNLLQIRQSGNN